MTTKSAAFLFSGYTFQQEQAFKATREQIRKQLHLHSGQRRCNPTRCEACGSGGMRWRCTTRTYRCHKCHHIQKAPARFTG